MSNGTFCLTMDLVKPGSGGSSLIGYGCMTGGWQGGCGSIIDTS